MLTPIAIVLFETMEVRGVELTETCGVATQSQTLVAEHKVKGVLHTPRLRAPNGNQPSLDTSVVVSAVCNKHDHILQQRAWGHCVVHALDDRSYQ